MLRLETDRLILRNYEEKDRKEVHETFSNEEVARYEDFYPMSMEEVTDLVKEWSEMDNRLVAVLKETGALIGSVGYWIDENGRYSIDYDFNPAYGKKGYATEAAACLLDYLFREVHIQEIYGDCDVRNTNSYRLLERLGFTRIGRNDQDSYKDDLNGEPIIICTYLYKKDKSQLLPTSQVY